MVGWWRQHHLVWGLLMRQWAQQQFGSAVGWWKQQLQQQLQQLLSDKARVGWGKLMARLAKLTWRESIMMVVFREQTEELH